MNSHLLWENSPLWEWLCTFGNPCKHEYDYIMNECWAYKLKDKGYVYFSWANLEDMYIHTALRRPPTPRQWMMILLLGELLGAKRLVYYDAPQSDSMANYGGFVNGVLELPHKRIKIKYLKQDD